MSQRLDVDVRQVGTCHASARWHAVHLNGRTTSVTSPLAAMLLFMSMDADVAIDRSIIEGSAAIGDRRHEGRDVQRPRSREMEFDAVYCAQVARPYHQIDQAHVD
jgi:hypothetical protein